MFYQILSSLNSNVSRAIGLLAVGLLTLIAGTLTLGNQLTHLFSRPVSFSTTVRLTGITGSSCKGEVNKQIFRVKNA
jgi:hypothetical protein